METVKGKIIVHILNADLIGGEENVYHGLSVCLRDTSKQWKW